MRIAMLGTRGVPAAYGGFETAIEEIGSRLAAAGNEITVYCRTHDRERHDEYKGMSLVHLPALRSKSLETLSHTALSVVHAVSTRRPDVAFVFNAANAPFVPLLSARGIPAAIHMDGLEWQRGKWGRIGSRYYRWAEALAVRRADALIADAKGIADYYRRTFAASTELLTYGAPVLAESAPDAITGFGLTPRRYHLVVARFEPENHVETIVDGYVASRSTYPLVVVGSSPYSGGYTARIMRAAGSDRRVMMLGAVWDQRQLDGLYAHALTYLHGHSVGGTNPSLLRAMGAGTAAIAWDVSFNHEVLGSDGEFFRTATDVTALVEASERDPDEAVARGRALQARAISIYNWDRVAAGYGFLAQRLAAGSSIRGTNRGRRHNGPGEGRPVVSPATAVAQQIGIERRPAA